MSAFDRNRPLRIFSEPDSNTQVFRQAPFLPCQQINLVVDAYTSGPSDSFPGTLNQFTGASPRTTGIWYDDTYDRSFFAAGSGCKGPPGAEGMAARCAYSPLTGTN